MVGIACGIGFIITVICVTLIVLSTERFGIYGFIAATCITIALWIWILNSLPKDEKEK